MRRLSYRVSPEETGMTLGHFLKKQGFSEKVLAALRRDAESMQTSGKQVFTNDTLEAGQELVVLLKEAPVSPLQSPVEPQVLPVILFEDEDILVVNKPAGMPVHVSSGHYEDTLGNALAWMHRGEHMKNATRNYHIINRLDRGSSGLVLVAKHRLAAGILSEGMRRGEIKATYVARCQGKTPTKGTIQAPIGRKEGSIIERCVREDGQAAVTHYETLQYDEGEDVSLVELTLETGRTHQIRVHMCHIGHPLLGDYLYHPLDHRMPHPALHRKNLRFVHPITKEKLEYEVEANWEKE